MAEQCTLYIDEAGDLGVKRGTRWFVITGVIVRKLDEPEIRKTIDMIRRKMNLHEIHFRNIRHFSGQLFICKALNAQPFCTINIIQDTETASHFTDPIASYNFMCRLLIERASWFMHDNGLAGDIVLSSRGTKRDGELIDYINNKLLNYEKNNIEKDVFRRVMSKTAPAWDMLQLADVCATSMFKAYEPDRNGLIFPCFMDNLRDHIYKRYGKEMTYGIKYLENPPEHGYFNDKYPCRKSAQK